MNNSKAMVTQMILVKLNGSQNNNKNKTNAPKGIMVSIEIISIHVILERQSRLYLCMCECICIYMGILGKYINGNIGKCIVYINVYTCLYICVYMYIQVKRRSHECEKQKSGCMWEVRVGKGK